jgi:hypothetical protein
MSARRAAVRRVAPEPKVAMTGLAGAFTTLMVAAFGFEWSQEVTAAVTTVFAFLIGYMTPRF